MRKWLCFMLVAAFTLAFTALPTPAQKPATALKEVASKDLLAELHLRSAYILKAELKPWTKDVKPESFPKNPFVKLSAADLTAKSKESKLKDFPAVALFNELKLRAMIKKGIFGTDDRTDLYRIETMRDELAALGGDTTYYDKVLANAKAVCSLIDKTGLSLTKDDKWVMVTRPYAEAQHPTIKLCPEEAFFSQRVGPFCTGFLVAPDVVVTAGHCVDATSVTDTRFVFGFRMTDASTVVTTFPKDNVYEGKTLLGHKLDNATGEDWAVVQLDRPVVGITPVKYRSAGKIGDTDPIYVIGFPSGLPCKVAGNARVRDNTNAFTFAGNLDTYGGNSGSPVFNRNTHEVEGILVRGGQDFEFVMDGVSGCIRSVALDDDVGREDCTRATIWADKIPMPKK